MGKKGFAKYICEYFEFRLIACSSGTALVRKYKVMKFSFHFGFFPMGFYLEIKFKIQMVTATKSQACSRGIIPVMHV